MTVRLRVWVLRLRLQRAFDVAGPVMVDIGAGVVISLLTISPAHAAGSGMPWEAPLERILESVQGPVAKIGRASCRERV